MTFVKGQSGNPKGKPKGAKSKKTQAWDELGDYIVNKGAKKYMDILTKSNQEDFQRRFETILEYFKPKQQRTDITSGGEAIKPPTITFVNEDSQEV